MLCTIFVCKYSQYISYFIIKKCKTISSYKLTVYLEANIALIVFAKKKNQWGILINPLTNACVSLPLDWRKMHKCPTAAFGSWNKMHLLRTALPQKRDAASYFGYKHTKYAGTESCLRLYWSDVSVSHTIQSVCFLNLNSSWPPGLMLRISLTLHLFKLSS